MFKIMVVVSILVVACALLVSFSVTLPLFTFLSCCRQYSVLRKNDLMKNGDKHDIHSELLLMSSARRMGNAGHPSTRPAFTVKRR